MSFYLYLPSNVCPTYFPDNRISNFKVKLPKRLKFNPNEYQVGLTEFNYVHSMKVLNKDVDREIILHNQVNAVRDQKDILKKVSIPNVNYSSINILIHYLNSAVSTNKSTCNVLFDYRKESNRVSISIKNGYIDISSNLSVLLGFRGQLAFPEGELLAVDPPDMLLGMFNIFIYCDIVESQIVGDTMAPLLRMVNISGGEGQAVSQTFRPYYISLSQLEFNTINILLCNEFGEEIQFDKGTAIVTLHFRKI